MRIGYSEEEDYPGQFDLWQANCARSLAGEKGQAALRRLEQALVALPDKRLIAGEMEDADGDVCAIGALAKHEGRTRETIRADWECEMEEVGIELGLPRLVAWKIVALNDVEIDGHYVDAEGPADRYGWRPKLFIHVTPEERYERVLAWVRAQLLGAG